MREGELNGLQAFNEESPKALKKYLKNQGQGLL